MIEAKDTQNPGALVVPKEGSKAEEIPTEMHSEESHNSQQGWGIVFSGVDRGGLVTQINTLSDILRAMEGRTSTEANIDFHRTLNMTHQSVATSPDISEASAAYVKFLQVREGTRGMVTKMFIANVGETAVYLYRKEVAKPLDFQGPRAASHLGNQIDHRDIQISDVPDDALLVLTSPAISVLTPEQISEIIKLNRKNIVEALIRAASESTRGSNSRSSQEFCEPVVVVLDPKEYNPAV